MGAALDYAKSGIRINAVAAGWTATPGLMSSPNINDENTTKIMSSLPTGRLGTADETADVIAFLSSPRASYVHGATWTVGGGLGLNATWLVE